MGVVLRQGVEGGFENFLSNDLAPEFRPELAELLVELRVALDPQHAAVGHDHAIRAEVTLGDGTELFRDRHYLVRDDDGHYYNIDKDKIDP